MNVQFALFQAEPCEFGTFAFAARRWLACGSVLQHAIIGEIQTHDGHRRCGVNQLFVTRKGDATGIEFNNATALSIPESASEDCCACELMERPEHSDPKDFKGFWIE